MQRINKVAFTNPSSSCPSHSKQTTTPLIDSKHFFDPLRFLDLPTSEDQVQLLVIPEQDPVPGWTGSTCVQPMAGKMSSYDGRCLFLFHCAGQAGLDMNGDLDFFAKDTRGTSILL